MADPGRHRLRTTFDEVADLYDRARPEYPEQLFEDLLHGRIEPMQLRFVRFDAVKAFELAGAVEHSAYSGPEGALGLDVFQAVCEDSVERWQQQ